MHADSLLTMPSTSKITRKNKLNIIATACGSEIDNNCNDIFPVRAQHLNKKDLKT